ncbi:MAG: asparagine synthase-related protein [Candidatus Omnitrophica bacterium]|nr:asparagine synthase-related protein [Candidatus Omnitrophota bacterium]
MNLLNIILDYSSPQIDPVIKDGYLSYGPVSLYAQRISIGDRPAKNFVFNRDRGILCGVIGYISNISDLREKVAASKNADDVDLIAELYLKEGEPSFPLLEGAFTAFVWDLTSQKGYIFQDENGSQTPLFYLKTKERYLFCNSLRVLLKNGGFPRKLNQEAVRDFLYSRVIIPSEATLVEGVHKLLPGQMIIVDLKAQLLEVQNIQRDNIKVSSDSAKRDLVSSIGKEVERLSALSGVPEIGAALSSGFDSNLMMHFLSKQFFKKITAVTIGGKKVNEISAASCCAAVYEKVRHLTAVVGDDRLRNLPDIVWRTEGQVFEVGLFLTNEFANILCREGLLVVFLGDGADQQLNPFRMAKRPFRLCLNKLKNRVKQRIVPLRMFWRVLKRKKIYVSKYPYAIQALRPSRQVSGYDIKKDYILKKSGVFFNSYGIQPFYPFLGRKTFNLARSLNSKECRRKKFYKNAVKEYLGPKIGQHLKKIGGTTDIEYLCQGKKELFERLLNQNLIIEILPGLNDKQKQKMLEDIPAYAESLVHLLYIYLFNELFITGKYDQSLDNAGFNLALEDFLIGVKPERGILKPASATVVTN